MLAGVINFPVGRHNMEPLSRRVNTDYYGEHLRSYTHLDAVWSKIGTHRLSSLAGPRDKTPTLVSPFTFHVKEVRAGPLGSSPRMSYRFPA